MTDEINEQLAYLSNVIDQILLYLETKDNIVRYSKSGLPNPSSRDLLICGSCGTDRASDAQIQAHISSEHKAYPIRV